jgi:long-subunit fatty acid transport protein
MTALGRGLVEGGGYLTLNKANIRDTGSTAATPGTLGAPLPLTGDPHGEHFAAIPVPNLYAAQPLRGGTLWLGLAVAAPFGSAVKYQRDWFGRYDAIETTLTVLDVAPSLAYRVTDALSVGAGIDVQYAYAKLVRVRCRIRSIQAARRPVPTVAQSWRATIGALASTSASSCDSATPHASVCTIVPASRIASTGPPTSLA